MPQGDEAKLMENMWEKKKVGRKWTQRGRRYQDVYSYGCILDGHSYDTRTELYQEGYRMWFCQKCIPGTKMSNVTDKFVLGIRFEQPNKDSADKNDKNYRKLTLLLRKPIGLTHRAMNEKTVHVNWVVEEVGLSLIHI